MEGRVRGERLMTMSSALLTRRNSFTARVTLRDVGFDSMVPAGTGAPPTDQTSRPQARTTL